MIPRLNRLHHYLVDSSDVLRYMAGAGTGQPSSSSASTSSLISSFPSPSVPDVVYIDIASRQKHYPTFTTRQQEQLLELLTEPTMEDHHTEIISSSSSSPLSASAETNNEGRIKAERLSDHEDDDQQEEQDMNHDHNMESSLVSAHHNPSSSIRTSAGRLLKRDRERLLCMAEQQLLTLGRLVAKHSVVVRRDRSHRAIQKESIDGILETFRSSDYEYLVYSPAAAPSDTVVARELDHDMQIAEEHRDI